MCSISGTHNDEQVTRRLFWREGTRNDLDEQSTTMGTRFDHLETGCLDADPDVVVETTASSRPRPGWSKPTLEAGDPRPVRASVFEKPKGPARAKHAPALAQSCRYVADRAQDEGSDDGVERAIWIGHCRCIAFGQCHRPIKPAGPLRGDRQGRSTRIDPVDRGPRWVGVEIEAGADADLEHSADGSAGDPRSRSADTRAVREPHRPVVQPRQRWPRDLQPLAADPYGQEAIAREIRELHQDRDRLQLPAVSPAQP